MHESLIQLVADYPAIGQPIGQPEPVGGGFSRAGVWKVSTDLGVFAFRRWPENSLSESRILGLHQLMRHLSNTGIDCVAVPLASVSGSTLVVRGGCFWQVEPWLPGVADFSSHPSTRKLSNAMRALAMWHAAASRFKPVGSATKWFASSANAASPAVRERARKSDDWLRVSFQALTQSHRLRENTAFADIARAIVQNATFAMPFVHRELSEAADHAFTLQPCLRDIWHDHVLFESDDVTGIVDPSACRTESIATDLARLLGSLVGDDQSQWRFALDCYSSHRTLSVKELRLIRILDRSAVVLSPLTWLRRKYIEGIPFDEHAVLPRLQRQNERLAVLTQSLRSS